MVDVEAKIRAQLCAFEQHTKQIVQKEQTQERTRQIKEPDPATIAYEPYPTLVAQFKSLLAEYDAVLQSDDKMRIGRHATDMTTLGSALNQIGGIDMMRFTVYTYAPQTDHNYVDVAWNGVGQWTA
jgi:hypothetical protein